MDFFQFNQNSTIVTDLNVIRHQRSQNQPFVFRLLASTPNVVAILPDFDGFLLILSKLNYLYRFSRHPTTAMPKLTRCLPPARWGPRDADSQCIGIIASFRCISSNFIKLDFKRGSQRAGPSDQPSASGLFLAQSSIVWNKRCGFLTPSAKSLS